MASPSPDELDTVPLFAPLTAEQRATVAGWLEVEDVSEDTRLTHQGAHGYSFFVLRRGTAAVTIDGSAVRDLGPGDHFGEIALLDDAGGRQTATVTTTSDATVWRMFGTTFRRFEQTDPEVAAALRRVAAERLAGDPRD